MLEYGAAFLEQNNRELEQLCELMSPRAQHVAFSLAEQELQAFPDQESELPGG